MITASTTKIRTSKATHFPANATNGLAWIHPSQHYKTLHCPAFVNIIREKASNRVPFGDAMSSGNKISVALLSVALVGLLLCHLATTASAHQKDIHVLGSVDGSSDGSSPESEGRVVYADMKLADTESDAPAPAPAPGPSSG